MAGMAAVAVGSKAIMLPSAMQSNRCSNARLEGAALTTRHGSMAVIVKSVAGLGTGKSFLHVRLQSKTSTKKKALTIVAANTEYRTAIPVEELTEEQKQLDGQKIQEAAQEIAQEYLEKIKGIWSKVDDKVAVGVLGGFGFVVLIGLGGFLSAVDKLPILPQFLEAVGLIVTGWFIYRYALFKPDREELFGIVDATKEKIL